MTAFGPALRECPGCGLIQEVPELAPGTTASCGRCGTVLHRFTGVPLSSSLALFLTALVLMVIMAASALMTVRSTGIVITADLLSGPEELVRQGMPSLAAVVLFVTLLAPLVRLAGTSYVLLGLRRRHPPRHLRHVFVWTERLRPWTMIEVFVFGVFVAYTKLDGIVQITLDVGLYALIALTVALLWADHALDREQVWRGIARDRPPPPLVRTHGAVGCEVCAQVSLPPRVPARCPRCLSVLHARKPDSVARTWALVIAAAVLYVPANVYPVLTVVQLGAGEPSTILGGVEELFADKMYPLAALVFFASILVPLLKLTGLSAMLISIQTGYAGWLHDRTRLYHVVRWIGRWSMIDIFMESLLGALVHFGTVITIAPGIGAVAFCAVVVLTMFAAETFDPRLMWDAADGSARFARGRLRPALAPHGQGSRG